MNTESIGADALRMRGTRMMLADCPDRRQRAVAEFPLRVVHIAMDMQKLCEMRDSGVTLSKEANDALQTMEDHIRSCYREMFGAELGQ